MATEQPSITSPKSVGREIGNFGKDLGDEVTFEVKEMKRTGDVVDPNHTDTLVQEHVTGLSMSLFVLIALILLAAIGGVYWYAHGSRATPTPGVSVAGLCDSAVNPLPG